MRIMADHSSQYTCCICKGNFPFDGIRYGPDGKKIVCIGCFNKVAMKQGAKNLQPAKQKEEVSAIPEKTKTINYICVSCRYKFSLKPDSRIPLRCPYCSKEDIMVDNSTADKLLEEASRE